VISAAISERTLGNSPARLRTASTSRLPSARCQLAGDRALGSQPERMFRTQVKGFPIADGRATIPRRERTSAGRDAHGTCRSVPRVSSRSIRASARSRFGTDVPMHGMRQRGQGRFGPKPATVSHMQGVFMGAAQSGPRPCGPASDSEALTRRSPHRGARGPLRTLARPGRPLATQGGPRLCLIHCNPNLQPDG
jgi:hypothetical protein